MEFLVQDRGAFSWALVKMRPGDHLISEAGALFRVSSNINIDVTTRSGKSGGFMAGIKRMLSGEHFFMSSYTVTDSADAEIGLAPTLQGQVQLIDCDGRANWVCAGGSYMASASGLELNTQFQGFKGMFTGESLFYVAVSGKGRMLVSAFGRITEINLDGALTVDTGHVVAFEDTLQYTVGKVTKGLIQTAMTGEGLVMNFRGRGKLYVQSHNPSQFGSKLGPLLPPRRA
ncbi:MAG: TIGR00266 family protein [SAR202 cluster bacterium]|nr:TIGR00266 family protein [SAR202 cluster bacterium]